MKLKSKILFTVFVGLSSYLYAQPTLLGIEENNSDIQKIIRASDIQRNEYQSESLALYQGNGRFGCSYGALGLHNRPDQSDTYGNTEYRHIKYWFRGAFNADYLLPLTKIYWESEPENIEKYSQHQSFYDGTLCTKYESKQYQVETTTWFDPVDRDLAGIKIRVKGEAPCIIIKPVLTKHSYSYNQIIEQHYTINRHNDLWDITLSCGNASTHFFVKTTADLVSEDSCLRIRLKQGENIILLSVNSSKPVTVSESIDRTVEWWHKKWESSGCLKLPDVEAQNMWVRSMALILSAYNDDGLGFTPPCAYTGNGWPFSFPQDISYIHPVFLATGNLDIAKAMIEYCVKRIPGMEAYTKKLYGVGGLFIPWEYPYGPLEGYHEPVPIIFEYEIHNSGYMARMAYETAAFVNDENWTKQYAVPLIREIALFYKNICTKGDDGFWHLYVTPSMGQDEMGGSNQKDYLCALFSAKYCFQKAIEYGLDEDGTYSKILKDGLNFPGLLSDRGFYYTCAGSGEQDFGKQKHPVQLNDLAYLPIYGSAQNPSITAYNLRYEITQNAKKPFFHGWTLGEFLLAGSRLGNVEQWLKDWNNLRESDYVDKDWIQIYETSGSHTTSFYSTSNGLLAQSLLNNLVSDWFGKLEIAKCNPWKGECRLYNIYSILGVKINGSISPEKINLELTAWKDCAFELNGIQISMKKGETKKIIKS